MFASEDVPLPPNTRMASEAGRPAAASGMRWPNFGAAGKSVLPPEKRRPGFDGNRKQARELYIPGLPYA